MRSVFSIIALVLITCFAVPSMASADQAPKPTPLVAVPSEATSAALELTVNSVPSRADCVANPIPGSGAVVPQMTFTANVTLTGAQAQLYGLGVSVPGGLWPFFTTMTPDADSWTSDVTFMSLLPDPIIISPYGGTIRFTLYRNGDIQRPIDGLGKVTTLGPCPGFAWPTVQQCNGDEWKLVHSGNGQKFTVTIGWAGEGGTVALNSGELVVSGYEAVVIKDEYNNTRPTRKYECPVDPNPTPTPTATPTVTPTVTPTATPDPTVVPPPVPTSTPPTVTPEPTVVPSVEPTLRLATKTVKVKKVKKSMVASIKLSCEGSRGRCAGKLTLKVGKTAVATAKYSLMAGKSATLKVLLSKSGVKLLKAKKKLKTNVTAALVAKSYQVTLKL